MAWDEYWTVRIYNCWDTAWVTSVMRFITDYTLASVVGVLATILYCFCKKDRMAIKITSLTYVGLAITELIIKETVGKLRPFLVMEGMAPLSSSLYETSFPSGHTMISFFVAYFIPNIFKWPLKYKYLLYLLAIVIAWSRVYLGMHYVFDVIAGVIIGSMAGIVAEMVYRKKSIEY